jgi:hypothetical protein
MCEALGSIPAPKKKKKKKKEKEKDKKNIKNKIKKIIMINSPVLASKKRFFRAT